jgi:hypothetical protein
VTQGPQLRHNVAHKVYSHQSAQLPFTQSRISALEGYDLLTTLQKDGNLEREIGLGPLRFELEDCIDDSLPMLCNSSTAFLNKQTVSSLTANLKWKN